MVNFPVGGHNNIREIWDGTVKSQPFVFVYVDKQYVILYVNYTCSGCKDNNLFSFHQIFFEFFILKFLFYSTFAGKGSKVHTKLKNKIDINQ